MFFPSVKLVNTSVEQAVFSFRYSDVNLDFDSQPDEFIYDIDAVIQAFLLLLATSKRERWWRPEYGTYDLERLLFEPFDIVTADRIAESIRSTNELRTNGNTRIEISGVSVQPVYDSQSYYTTLRISVPSLNAEKSVSFTLRRPT